MFYFAGTRKPNFKGVGRINYDSYWDKRGVVINTKLKEREEVVFSYIPQGSNVFDISCGSSLLPIELKKKNCKVRVSDVSQNILNEFKKLSIETSVIDLDKISEIKLDEKFDYIILSEVLEHIPNPEEVVKHLSKYTKYFVLTVPNSAFYRYRINLMFFGRFFTQWFYHPSEHVRFWSYSDFKTWIKDMDLDLVFSKSSNGFSLFSIPFHQIWKNMFGHQIVYIAKTK